MHSTKKILNVTQRKKSWMHPIVWALASYGVAEVYKRRVPADLKAKWQNFVNIHHGEAGLAGLVIGAITDSPSLAATGLGLAYHDRADSAKWFKSNKLQ